ncbi:MAG: hypothetical protein ACREAB_18880 [Blastocatellia bacterium]
MTLQSVLVLIMGSAGLLWYYVCLFNIGLRPLKPEETANAFRQFMSLSITSIGVTLATFVGMLLGVRSVSDTVKGAVEVSQSTIPAPLVKQIIESGLTTNLQWGAAGVYIVSLCIALWFWYRGGDRTDPAISNLGKSILGLFAGALTIVLNL